MPSAKIASLTALCVHYSVLTVVMHISRTSTSSSPSSTSSSCLPSSSSPDPSSCDSTPVPEKYKASSAVVVTEIGKLVISLLLAARQVKRSIEEEREEARREKEEARFSHHQQDADAGEYGREKEVEVVEKKALVEGGGRGPAPRRPNGYRSASYTHSRSPSPQPPSHTRHASSHLPSTTTSTTSSRVPSSAGSPSPRHGKRKSVTSSPLNFGPRHGRTSSAKFNVSIVPPTPDRAPGLGIEGDLGGLVEAGSLPSTPVLGSFASTSDSSRRGSHSSTYEDDTEHRRSPSLPYAPFPPTPSAPPAYSSPTQHQVGE